MKLSTRLNCSLVFDALWNIIILIYYLRTKININFDLKEIRENLDSYIWK